MTGVESCCFRTMKFLNLSHVQKTTTSLKIPTPTAAPDHLLGGHNEPGGKNDFSPIDPFWSNKNTHRFFVCRLFGFQDDRCNRTGQRTSAEAASIRATSRSKPGQPTALGLIKLRRYRALSGSHYWLGYCYL